MSGSQVVIDLVTRLPRAIWFLENPRASDTRFEDNLLELVSAETLLLLDRGFYHFQFWQQLIESGVHLITRIKINAVIEYQQVFTDSYALRDRLVKVGSGTKTTSFVTLRLIEIRVGKSWRSYLTSVLEPETLPPYIVIDLYQKRWRIEHIRVEESISTSPLSSETERETFASLGYSMCLPFVLYGLQALNLINN